MSTTFADLLHEVDGATLALRGSRQVPEPVEELVDRFDVVLHADAPLQLEGDPYLVTMVFAGALRAGKALRHDDADHRRRDLRLALEQVRQALRDLVDGTPVAAGTPVGEVLATLVDTVSAPQADLAALLGVSVRQLQRWLSPGGTAPTGDDEARIRVVAQVAAQLRHVYTGPGVLAWFHRRHPVLDVAPVELLGDPLAYPRLVDAATGARSMAG